MQKKLKQINNSFYDDLHEGWYTKKNHPIALLRAENALRNPWIANVISKCFQKDVNVLDIGCGGGLLTNFLASKGHEVHGIDLSCSSLEMAKKNDTTSRVTYLKADATFLPFDNKKFDVVIAMDILEHIERPDLLVKEASRVLNDGGLFFFHTFNRNFFSWLMIIQAVDWLVPNAPVNMHVYHLFIKPKELSSLCQKNHLFWEEVQGVRPKMSSAFWRSLKQKSVNPNFEFTFCSSLLTGYCGYAKKK